MIYRHAFPVRAPAEQVRALQAAPEALAAVTPPPTLLQLRHAPASLELGRLREAQLVLAEATQSSLPRGRAPMPPEEAE